MLLLVQAKIKILKQLTPTVEHPTHPKRRTDDSLTHDSMTDDSITHDSMTDDSITNVSILLYLDDGR